MLLKLIQKLAGKIKQEPYVLDKYISDRDLLYFLAKRILMLLRGIIFLRESVFLGKRVDIYYKYKIKFGKFVSLHDGVEIDALSKNGITLGSKVSIGKNSFIRCTATLEELGDGLIIGDNVGIGGNAFLGCWGGIVINSNTIIGERFTVHSDNHEFSDKTVLIRHQGVKKLPVIIGENCWIGSNVTILGGVQIGNGCVIGAGTIVTKSIQANSVVVGNPGRILKER
jgi:acetyltransferase-like isoleucine patch superfamily enzyme